MGGADGRRGERSNRFSGCGGMGSADVVDQNGKNDRRTGHHVPGDRLRLPLRIPDQRRANHGKNRLEQGEKRHRDRLRPGLADEIDQIASRRSNGCGQKQNQDHFTAPAHAVPAQQPNRNAENTAGDNLDCAEEQRGVLSGEAAGG